ncbi:hexose transporter hxt1 [Curvularia kusanoi]|uniref:Hexose transporter hxt1 n=1 Tax=Curvularia kusanoi TaxID=90978 RepID=A0A9P4W683_CURKU|nr:hexose transporter hxt1 [Curvularia kusanoi]
MTNSISTESSPRGGAIVTEDDVPQGRVPMIAIVLGAVASIGGFIFGYESGQISGFLAMSDFIDRFGHNGEFSAVRQGTIVGMLAIGTLCGCLCSAPLADTFGRRLTISGSAFFYIVGVIIEITSDTVWVQFAMGRFTAGLGIGALSTVVPMYQSESIPKRIRAAAVSSYQLFITLGIWTAYMINYGTVRGYNDSAQWRITVGLSALWAIILGSTILLLPESPRFAYRKGRVDEARLNMARLEGVSSHSAYVDSEIREIQEKIDTESGVTVHHWYEIFTGPRMLYRTLLGMVLQAGQQLTGANYFFYFGTTIFTATGLDDSYVTSIILGTVNVAATVIGLWIVEHVGRRKAMMCGAAWMGVCLFIYAFVGHFQLDQSNPQRTPAAGNVMIVFTCLFIAAFATTWGPLVWTMVGELYPARYRAICMALATASNWLFNFLISFFSTMIANKIDYLYGLVFGGCCFALFFIVYFFVIETKGRSLEEIDTMYVLHVNPISSASWRDPTHQKYGSVDKRKPQTNPAGETELAEHRVS